jgi:VIT1/CCC1 family predicted Fe2+/Mn2+ transporter
MDMTPELKKKLLLIEDTELTEYYIYRQLARLQKNPENRRVLERIADEEKGHHDFWATQSGQEGRVHKGRVSFYVFVSRLFGLTFGVKLMEQGEKKAEAAYRQIASLFPEASRIADDEERHEKELLALLSEERLEYVGAIVLGLNDALVELTGALAGLTFAFQNTRTIALAGLITGIAASLSMAASQFLSSRSDGKENAGKSAVYTGIAYILTVALLVLPYLMLQNYLLALGLTLTAAVLIIFFFNYYISVAKDLPFWKRFLEMAVISLGVAGFSFGVGYLIRRFLGVEL